MNIFTKRSVVAVLLFHAVLLPTLFFSVLTAVESGQQNAFIDDVRVIARIVADMFESTNVLESESATIAQLDSVILGGKGTYATLTIGDQALTSSLMSAEDDNLFVEDFKFGDHGDDVYFVSVPVTSRNLAATLRLGFDETQTLQNIDRVRSAIAYILFGYFLISIMMVVVLNRLLNNPSQQPLPVSQETAPTIPIAKGEVRH